MMVQPYAGVSEAAAALACEGFAPPREKRFGSHPAWAALRETGTRLWLDTGDVDAASNLWTDDFSNLTTNNTLVNREVQKGLFDDLIPRAARTLREADPALGADALVLEVGFVVNCRTALRLVEAFDATVSVELHPGMAKDVERSVEYGRRYHAVCPERFIIKVPLAPAGFLAARRLAADGIPVNYTLGFSARQNVIAAAFSRPAFVNVFLGRLNSFVAESGLGDGRFVGEKAAMATQVALLQGRREHGWSSLLIAASMRAASQVLDLAGTDVFTMPTGVAEEFRSLFETEPRAIRSQVGREFEVVSEERPVVDKLWSVPPEIHELCDLLARKDVTAWTGSDFEAFVHAQGPRDLFRRWTRDELSHIRADGKIPKWERWRDDLRAGRLALDDLLTTSALQSFVTDQEALDGRIRRLLDEARVTG